MIKCSRVKCKNFAGWGVKNIKPCPKCVDEDKKRTPMSSSLKVLEGIMSKL